MEISIGRLSAETGVKVPTIRYYEDIGLMAKPPRSGGNQRKYDRAARERLRFIRHARDLGFPLEAVRELLSMSGTPDNPCTAADEIARRQLAQVELRIARLSALRDELQRMIGQCAHGTISDCRVIEVLGNHELCHHTHASTAGPEDARGQDV